ncbi:cytochrome P450 4c3-like [Zophobas morio]|uniref:cytochrome P450 4c3-like n=1 Tax=Zophobas morio TaxID=2755281 RepID=UPI003083CFA4
MNYLQATPEIMFHRLREAFRHFYPIYKLYAFHKISANILSPEDCELIMCNPIHNRKGQVYDLIRWWLKDGLLTSEGPKWQARRKILTPAFHFSILQQFVQIFNEEGEKLVEVLKHECAKSYVNVTPHITQFTLKTIVETAMGTKLQFQTQEEKNYKQAVYDIGQILIYRIKHPWFIYPILNYFSPWYFQERKVTNTLHKFSRDVIRDREKSFSDIEVPKDDVYKGKKRLAMLDLLLSAKMERLIDDEGVQEEVDTFMFEGHDTTAVALGFLLMLIACHQDIQEQIVQEMCDVFGDLKTRPTYSDLQSLKYMERCIKESLRLYPSVHFITRTLGQDVRTRSGYLLPKDTIAVIHIYDVHHNPDIYPDPEKFDPDRFLPDNSQNRHPFAFLPFSAGPRNCIGQRFAMLELKSALCAILGNFVLEAVDTPETIVVVVDIVLRTKEGIKIRLVPRT